MKNCIDTDCVSFNECFPHNCHRVADGLCVLNCSGYTTGKEPEGEPMEETERNELLKAIETTLYENIGSYGGHGVEKAILKTLEGLDVLKPFSNGEPMEEYNLKFNDLKVNGDYIRQRRSFPFHVDKEGVPRSKGGIGSMMIVGDRFKEKKEPLTFERIRKECVPGVTTLKCGGIARRYVGFYSDGRLLTECEAIQGSDEIWIESRIKDWEIVEGEK